MVTKDSFTVIQQKDVFLLIKKFKEHLEKIAIPVQEIYLYGSYGKGTARYGSDIDVCVISPAFDDRFESNLLLRREAIKIDVRIEPVAYSPEKFEDWIPLVWEIKKTGVAIT